MMNNLMQPILIKQSRLLQLASRRINIDSIQNFSNAKTFNFARGTHWRTNRNNHDARLMRSLSSAAATSDISSPRKKRRVDPLIVVRISTLY